MSQSPFSFFRLLRISLSLSERLREKISILQEDISGGDFLYDDLQSIPLYFQRSAARKNLIDVHDLGMEEIIRQHISILSSHILKESSDRDVHDSARNALLEYACAAFIPLTISTGDLGQSSGIKSQSREDFHLSSSCTAQAIFNEGEQEGGDERKKADAS